MWPRLIPVSFIARAELEQLYNSFNNLENYISAIWKMREPVEPVLINKGGYPIIRIPKPQNNIMQMHKGKRESKS